MKKLTDKIYIAESNSHPGFFAQEYFLPYKWGRFKSIEYLLKDALLEFLKKKVNEIEIAMETGADDPVLWGQRNAFKQVIDKINSM